MRSHDEDALALRIRVDRWTYTAQRDPGSISTRLHRSFATRSRIIYPDEDTISLLYTSDQHKANSHYVLITQRRHEAVSASIWNPAIYRQVHILTGAAATVRYSARKTTIRFGARKNTVRYGARKTTYAEMVRRRIYLLSYTFAAKSCYKRTHRQRTSLPARNQ